MQNILVTLKKKETFFTKFHSNLIFIIKKKKKVFVSIFSIKKGSAIQFLLSWHLVILTKAQPTFFARHPTPPVRFDNPNGREGRTR